MNKRFLSGRRKEGVLITLTMLILQAFAVLEARAQTTGTIYGTISDANGAAVSGATVTVTHLETNLKRTTVTGTGGAYTFKLLHVGRYNIAVEAQGFKPYEQKEVELQVEANQRVDFQLEV